MSRISNASSSVDGVLGVARSYIIGQNIHKLMPSFYAVEHEKKIKKWLTCDFLNVSPLKFTETVTVDCHGVAFSCSVSLKFHSDGSSLKVYKLVVKDNDQDYVVLDNRQ